MSKYSRRSVLALGAAAGLAVAGGLAGCSRPGPGTSGRVELRFAYWGNAVRQKLTTRAVQAFQRAHPHIRVSLEYGQIEGYFDKLATQMAANDAPDVFQLNEKFLPEYARREALLDLKNVDVSDFTPGTREPGVSNGVLAGINAGVNAPTILANPAAFRAAGVKLPDDRTWTWNDLADISARLTAARPGTRGMASMVASDAALGVYLRQFGAALFAGDKLGFTAGQLASWFDFNLALLKRGSVPPAAEATEDAAAPIGQRGFAQQRYAIVSDYSKSTSWRTRTRPVRPCWQSVDCRRTRRSASTSRTPCHRRTGARSTISNRSHPSWDRHLIRYPRAEVSCPACWRGTRPRCCSAGCRRTRPP